MTGNSRILAIESSCDETAAAVVENGRRMLAGIVASQASQHARYGGVFPEAASRMHIEAIYSVVAETLTQAHVGLEAIDAIAVTRGPGLAGSLVVGFDATQISPGSVWAMDERSSSPQGSTASSARSSIV